MNSVNMCYPMSIDPGDTGSRAVYAATSMDRIVRFTAEEKVALFTALYQTVPEYRSQLRIFTPLTSVLTLIRQYQGGANGYACRGGIDFFFVNSSDGNTYPCGYRGTDNLGKFWELQPSRLDARQHCTQCDWECFRDPSELAGPLLEFPRSPLQTAARLWHDREYARHWWRDLHYYRACDYFCGRKPPDARRLTKFRGSKADSGQSMVDTVDPHPRQPVPSSSFE